MRSNSQHRQDVTAKHCAICNGRFGLIRHHCWQTALCSKRCVERLKARQEGDRK